MAGTEVVQTTYHPNDLAEAWTGMAEEFRANAENRLATENQERMAQSEAEMAEFERKLSLSPEEYWQELRDGYAQSGINLGLMPDVREMQEYAEEHLAQSIGGGEQGERAELALKTELGRMAQTKAEEVRRWQSEGRGLPITFESEWVKSGQNDIKNLLDQYYEVDEKLSRDARLNGGLTGDEQVAWMMAALPRKPRTLDAVWTFKSNQGRFEGETTAEYYNRLKNYQMQDQMRDWQIEQDEGKVIARKSEEELLREEAMLAEEERARDPEGVEEAIRETDREVEEIWQEREKAKREEVTKEVRKKPGFLRVVKKLAAKFVDLMRLEDTTEEDEAYYAEMERQEREKAEAEKAAEVEETEVANAVEEAPKARTMEVNGIRVERLMPEQVERLMVFKRRAEQALDDERSLQDMAERNSIKENYQKLVALLDAYEKSNDGDLSEVIEYQTQKALERHELPEVEEKVDEKIDEKVMNFGRNFDVMWLQQRGLFSGEMNREGLEELKVTKTRLVNEMFADVEDENNKEVRENVLAEYRERLRVIDGVIKRLEKETEEAGVEQETGPMPLAETA